MDKLSKEGITLEKVKLMEGTAFYERDLVSFGQGGGGGAGERREE